MSGKPGIHTKSVKPNLVTKQYKFTQKVKPVPPSRKGKTRGPRNTDKSSKFRDDLFWVYKEWGGKDKILNLLKEDEKNDMQKHFIKSLIALYGKELDIKLKQMAMKGGIEGTGKNFIFIMDGLGGKDGVKVAAGIQSIPMQTLAQMVGLDTPQEEEDEKLDVEPAE